MPNGNYTNAHSQLPSNASVVAVAETALDGARDFIVVDALHTFILDNRETTRAILNFLEFGRFSDPAE